jgi:hypothetical protein
LSINSLAHRDSALQGAQGVNPAGVDAGGLRQNRGSPGRDQELVESFLYDFPGSQIFGANGPLSKIDGRDAVLNPDVNVLFFPEDLGGADDQRI